MSQASIPRSGVAPPPKASEQVTIAIPENKKEVKPEGRGRSTSKFTPPPKKGILDELQFAPYARHVNTAMVYVLVMVGIVTLAMTTRMQNLGPGIYAFCAAILIYVWHFIGDFNKVDKTAEGMLENKGWPTIVCKVLTILNHNAFACIGTLLLSGYLFACVQTAVAGGGLVLASFLYLIALIRREKTKPITGLT
jgi:hypothetical protein